MEVRELKNPTDAEWNRTVEVITDSFWQTPMFYSYLFRGRKELARLFMEAMAMYGLRAGRLFVEEDGLAGIVACAVWSGPDTPELNLSSYLKLGIWPQMLRIALASPAAMARINHLFAMLDKYAPDFPCATLEFLASAQKGAGAALLRGCMSAFTPLPLYIESIVSKNDHAFYRQFGFQPFDRTDFHGTDYAFLLYQPEEGEPSDSRAAPVT